MQILRFFFWNDYVSKNTALLLYNSTFPKYICRLSKQWYQTWFVVFIIQNRIIAIHLIPFEKRTELVSYVSANLVVNPGKVQAIIVDT